MARTKNPAPGAAHSAVNTATSSGPEARSPAAGDSPAAAVLAALSAEPGGAAVAVIAGHAGISVAAARQALIAHDKAGTAMRVKGGRPGIPDTWRSAAVAGIAEGGELEAATEPDSDPAVTAEVAGKALAAGDLPAALAALDAVREQAALGRRALKAAASGRHASATRPGALRDLVEEHLRTFPDAAFTPHQIGKVLTRSAGAVANALDKLVGLGTAELASEKPRSYRLAPAPAPAAAGDPGTSTEAAPSAA